MGPSIVAVVEDDASLRKALGRLLLAAEFEPHLFETAEAYLEASLSPRCIVMDVRLPGMSGLDLQETLIAAGNATPVIVITASHDAEIRERAHRNGCFGFFLKPVDGNTLIATVESVGVH
jgi:FixJ family two-component response regulator